MKRFRRRSPAPPVPETEEPDNQPVGLFQLYPDPELSGSSGIETNVDIIAIHGLGGHPYKTWTDGEKLWLRDFLPKDLNRARIFTFGYNAGLAFTSSKSTIRDYSIQLLESLRQLRRRTANDDVKTIFVCHSLGGIVFKEALIVAHERTMTYGPVAASVKGVVFLGTPHRGSNMAYWSGLLTKFANIAVLGRLRQDLLDNLQPKSSELDTISAQFVERGMTLQIFSLYERLTMPVINSLVVDEFSAVLHLPNETAVPLEANHQTICKFLTSSNPSYIRVRDCIDEIVETLVKLSGKSYFTPTQDMFLRRLRVINEADMLRRVPLPWGQSHQWLFTHASFQSWMAYQGCRVLWLYGPPGSGKTVLSKTVIIYLNKLSETSTSPDIIIRKSVYFFFDDKDPKTQTSTAFASSILYQILDDSRTGFVVRYLDNVHLNRLDPDEDTLWACLLSIIQYSRGIIFQFVVDAVDELSRVQTSNISVLDRLEQLLSADVSGHMRLLITDRVRPNEGFSRSVKPAILDVDNLATRQVVEEYIRAQVRGQLERARINPQAGIGVETKILEISGGNFLMASLVWRQFSDGVKVWSRDAIRLRVQEIHKLSSDLETVYCGFLKSLPTQWRKEARRAFAILRISFERLSSRQLSLLVTIWNFNCNSMEFNLREVEEERSDFEFYIHERCGYIVHKNDNGLVNFAHQSAKDLFAGETKNPENAKVLQEYIRTESDSHSIIFYICIKIFQAEGHEFNRNKIFSIVREAFDEADRLNLPLEKRSMMIIATLKSKIQKSSRTSCLLYALRYWFEHYLKATPSPMLDREAVKFFNSSVGGNFHLLWTEITPFTNTIARFIPVAKFSHPLLNAILRGDSGRLIKEMLDSGIDPNFLGPQDVTPLGWAVICDRQEAFLALMRSDLVSINLGTKGCNTAVHLAATSENPFFLQRMVTDSRTNLNCRGKFNRTPLLMAIKQKRHSSVEILLEQPYVDTWLTDEEGEVALTMAFQHPMWEDVVLKMMDVDWEKTMRTLNSKTQLLELARVHQWHRVESDLLTRSDRQLLHVDYYSGLSPVSTLAFYGRRITFLQYLKRLSTEQIQKINSLGRYSVLHLCANQNWEDIVRRLMNDHNIKPLPQDHTKRTLLHWALEFDWDIRETEITGLCAGQINQQDRDGMTALHLAVSKRNLTVITWIVAAKADIFLKDKRGFTPAHLAAEDGYRCGVEYFTRLTKRDFGKTRQGLSLIHLISLWLEGSVTKQFVESRHTSVNLVDKTKCTPLHYAAQTGNMSAVQMLIEKGARVNAKDAYGRTPLHHAIRSGTADVALILLENDADMNLTDFYGQTCLHLSIRHQHETLTQWLLPRREEFIFERDHFGFTPLHRACTNGTASEVIELLDRGADSLDRDSNFRTPLEHAVIGRNKNTVKALLASHQDNEFQAREWIRSMNAALRLSVAKELPEIESVLLKAGAWVLDRSKIEIEQFYVPDDFREDRWPLVTYRRWDEEYAKDSYDPSVG